MKKVAVVTGVSMIALAGYIVSQTGVIGSPVIKGQLVDTEESVISSEGASASVSQCEDAHLQELSACTDTFNAAKDSCEAAYTACIQSANNEDEQGQCNELGESCLNSAMDSTIACQNDANQRLLGCRGQNTSEESTKISSAGQTDGELWDCAGIRAENERTCGTLEGEGTLLCSDGYQDCLDSCIYPWPAISFCTQSCRSAQAVCDYKLTTSVIFCNNRTYESFRDCLAHNTQLEATKKNSSSQAMSTPSDATMPTMSSSNFSANAVAPSDTMPQSSSMYFGN